MSRRSEQRAIDRACDSLAICTDDPWLAAAATAAVNGLRRAQREAARQQVRSTVWTGRNGGRVSMAADEEPEA